MGEIILQCMFFKKLKYKKLLLVKLLGNTACSPFLLAELDSLEVDCLLRLIRTHWLLPSLKNCFKISKRKNLLGNTECNFSLMDGLIVLRLSGCYQYIWENIFQYIVFEKPKYKKLLLVILLWNTSNLADAAL